MGPVDGYGRRGVGQWLWDFLRSDNTDGVFYGWRVVAIAFLVILVGREIGYGFIETVWGSRDYQGEGIGPPWTLLAIALSPIGGLASLWIAGWGADRFGPKRMAQIGLTLVGLIVLFACLPGPFVLEVAIAGVVALGMIGAYVPAVTMLNHWFRDRLPLAVALTLFGSAIVGEIIGLLLALPLLLVDWRILTLAGGAAILVVALPLVRAIRNRPEDWGEHPDGVAPARMIPDYHWREAVRSRQFWTLIAAGCCVAGAESISTVYGWQVISRTEATGENIDQFGTLRDYASVAGILAGGLACCRLPVWWVLSGAATAQAVGMVLLLSGFEPALLEIGVLLGAASGMGTAPAIAAVGIYFGRRSFGILTVTAFLILYVASAAALPAAGYLAYLDVVPGVYIAILIAAAILSLIGAGLFWKIGQPRLAPTQLAAATAIS